MNIDIDQVLSDLPDEDLLDKIREGNKEAYRIIVDRYMTKLWRLAMTVLHNQTDSEDAVQDVLLSVWKNRDHWEEGAAKFSTWIYRVTLNRCIDIKRQKKTTANTETIEDIIPDEARGAEENIAALEQNSFILEHLMQLPEKQRIALVLFYYEELSIKQISDKLSVSEQSIRSLLSRGRSALKERFGNESNYKNRGLQEAT